MPNTPADDALADGLRHAFAATAHGVDVPDDLTERVRAGRRRAHRRAVAVRVALPVAAVAAGALALTAVGPASTSGPDTFAGGSSAETTDVSFRLVADRSGGGATAREKECLKLGRAGFTAAMTDDQLSLNDASGGCLRVLVQPDETGRFRGTFSRGSDVGADTLTLKLRGAASRDAHGVTIVVTGVDQASPILARIESRDVVLSRS